MKTAAIVGVNSMLGRQLAVQLREQNISVIGIGRDPNNEIVLDLDNSVDYGEVSYKADVIFHCASAFEGDDFVGLRVNFTTNVVGCVNVLALMEQLECSVCVYAGTVFSINGADSNSLSGYGFSKAQGEQLLEWGLARVNKRFCSIRFSQLYDTEGLCCVHQPWFGRIISYASRGLELRLPEPFSGSRNFIHVIDAARLMIQAVETRVSGCWPLCHSEYLNYQQIAELAYQEFNKGGQITIDKNKVPFRSFNFPKNCRVYDQLQDKPKISMADGIAMIHHTGQADKFGPLDVQ
ncbi:MAG: NAD-dependent epimerase/dehydratase family protein [Methylomarinum sp.]|nr:NAD-dependent epimerase/dehydratase family protein [Methylomarinum sp.]